MKLGITPSGHAPGRGTFKDSGRVSRVLTSVLVMMITLLPMQAVTAGPGKTDAKVSPAKKANNKHQPHPRDKTLMKRQWGVEVMFVRQTSAGYMLEFRYKVLDADKAMPLFERQTKPQLTHTKTGATLIVPTPAKTGALRNSNPPQAGKTYWMFFANPGKLVQSGDQVNIDIGAFRANGLVVQ